MEDSKENIVDVINTSASSAKTNNKGINTAKLKVKAGFNKFWSVFGKIYKGVSYFITFLIVLTIIFGGKLDTVEYSGEKIRYQKLSEKGSDDNIIAQVDFSGVITGDCSTNNSCASRFNTLLDYLEQEDKIKAIVIFLDSPGGEVYASDMIYNKLKEVSGVKPVYIYGRNMIASGAYYLSLGATRIYANNLTTIGSIGVLVELTNYDGLLDKLGIKVRRMTNTGGKYKTMEGLFDDNPNGEEDKMLQSILDTTYNQFVQRIVDNRAIPISEVRAIADGRIMTAKEALNIGLIDEVIDEDNFINEVESNVCSRDCTVYKYEIEPYSLFDSLMMKLNISKITSENNKFHVLYIYH